MIKGLLGQGLDFKFPVGYSCFFFFFFLAYNDLCTENVYNLGLSFQILILMP